MAFAYWPGLMRIRPPPNAQLETQKSPHGEFIQAVVLLVLLMMEVVPVYAVHYVFMARYCGMGDNASCIRLQCSAQFFKVVVTLCSSGMRMRNGTA